MSEPSLARLFCIRPGAVAGADPRVYGWYSRDGPMVQYGTGTGTGTGSVMVMVKVGPY